MLSEITEAKSYENTSIESHSIKEDDIDNTDELFKLVASKYKESNVFLDAEFNATLEGVFFTNRKRDTKIDLKILVSKSLKYNFDEILIYIIENSYEKFISLISSNTNEIINNKFFASTLAYCVNIVRNYSSISSKFRYKFQENKGVEIIFKYLNNQLLLDSYIREAYQDENNFSFAILHSVIRGSIGILSNLSKSLFDFKDIWNKCHAVIFYIYNIERQFLKRDINNTSNL